MADDKGFAKWGVAVEIPVGMIDCEELNPNEMSEERLQQLVEEIQKTGFDEPLQVAPKEGGRFVVIGGEHRWRAVQRLGLAVVPCTVKDGLTEEQRLTMMARRNELRGDVNAVKYARLVKHIQDKSGADVDVIRQQMGVLDPAKFARYLEGESDRVNKATDKAKEDTHIIDNTSYVVTEILAQFGETIPAGFVFFCYKNRLHLVVQCEEPLYKVVKGMAEGLKRDGEKINDFMFDALGAAAKAQGWEPDKAGYAPAEGKA